MALKLDADFFPRLLEMEARGAIARAEDALKIFSSESNLDPTTRNSIGCVGLNQMCKGTLEAFFKGDGNARDFASLAAQYLALPGSLQLDAVEKLWTYRAGMSGIQGPPTGLQIYWLNFLPATFVIPSTLETLLAPSAALTRLGIDASNIIAANLSFAERDDASGVSLASHTNLAPKYLTGKWCIRARGLQSALDRGSDTSNYRDALVALQNARLRGPEGPPAPPPDPTPITPPTDVPTVVVPGGVPAKSPVSPFMIGVGLVIAVLAALAAALRK